MESTIIRHISKSDSLETIAGIVNRAFRYLESKTGFPERLSVYQNSYYDAEYLSDAAVVALIEEKIVGVCFLSKKENSNIRSISLLAVDPDFHNIRVGRRLLLSAIDLAKSQGAVSIRLVVNAYSTNSFPLYIRIGFSIKEPLALIELAHGSSVPAMNVARDYPQALSEDWQVLMIEEHHLESIERFCDEKIGHNRVNDIRSTIIDFKRTGYRPYKPWFLRVKDSSSPDNYRIAAIVSGFTWDNYSVAESEIHWKYLIHHILYNYFSQNYSDPQFEIAKMNGVKEEQPNFLVTTISMPHLFKWCIDELRLRLVKTEFLMVLGEYDNNFNGIYMPGVEY